MIEFTDVIVEFGDIRAVGPIDLTVASSETTVLIGSSGCGKSTILRVIAGLVEPVSGEVFVDGSPVNPATVQKLRRRIGYVIQEGGLFPHLTAEQNLTLLDQLDRRPPEETRNRIQELCALTHLPENCLGRRPQDLSGGQRQRVALMRALMRDPDILLLDEPLGALDPIIRHDLQSELRDIFKSLGKTVLMVTHDIAEAGFLGNRLILLQDGRIAQQGSLAEFLDNPKDDYVRRFVSSHRSVSDIAGARR